MVAGLFYDRHEDRSQFVTFTSEGLEFVRRNYSAVDEAYFRAPNASR
jgi:hypothetical protein